MNKKLLVIIIAVVFIAGGGIAWNSKKNKPVGPEGTNGNYVIAYDLYAWTLRQKWMNTGSINDSLIVRGSNNYFRRIAPLSETLSGYMSIPAANTAIATMQNDINGKVPNARQLTINGTTFDLSSNRTWTIPTSTYTAGTGITISGNVISRTKRQETYSGTTNASGIYTVTFSTPYSVAPNIQAGLINGADNQNLRVTSITANGFTVLARNRVDVVGLLPTWTNVSGIGVDVLITEK